MNFNGVKKITLADLVIVIGLILMVLGLGIKIKGVSEINTENKYIKVERNIEAVVLSVDINTASSVELETLPAIGPKTAQKIIDYRNERGPFKSKEEIKKVSGIGEKTYEKIREKIKI